MALQVMFFNNLSFGLFVTPLVYIIFVLLLPMNTPGIATLAAALVSGIIADLSMGTAGINTIAMLAVGYLRLPVLNAIVGGEETKTTNAPNSLNLGAKRFLRYCMVMVLLQCLLFFGLESLTWGYLHFTALRIVLSAIATVFFLYLLQLLFSFR